MPRQQCRTQTTMLCPDNNAMHRQQCHAKTAMPCPDNNATAMPCPDNNAMPRQQCRAQTTMLCPDNNAVPIQQCRAQTTMLCPDNKLMTLPKQLLNSNTVFKKYKRIKLTGSDLTSLAILIHELLSLFVLFQPEVARCCGVASVCLCARSSSTHCWRCCSGGGGGGLPGCLPNHPAA